MLPPTLHSERLVLRPVSREDAPAIQKHFARWNIIRYLSTECPWPYPADGALRFIEDTALPEMARGARLVWVIVPRQGPQEAVGMVDVRLEGERLSQRGFWLAEAYQGRGYMTEAVTAVQDFLFFEHGLERLRVTNAVENAASRRVKEKTGARYLGRVSCAHHEGGAESEQWEITREAWTKLRRG